MASAAGFAACSPAKPQPPEPPRVVLDAAPPIVETPVVPAAGAEVAVVDASVDAAPVAALPPEPPLEGDNLLAEVRAVYRVAACADADASYIPKNLPQEMVDQHCAELRPSYDEYKREWLAVAGPFLDKIRPKGLPTTVVYPFGGGDLVSALATYPDAMVLTTISLESIGDARTILKADKSKLERELGHLRDHLAKLFLKAHSRTVNLELDSRNGIAGEVAFTMAALVVHGYEPTALRYFWIQPDGSVHYLTTAELNDPRNKKTAFDNVETRFQKRGGGPTRVLRHIAFDLSDGNLAKKPYLLKYLDREAQSSGGKVSEMTKAASHLLWNDGNFGVIRNWLATHTDCMISDTTGFPPRIAKQYGFVQDLYGQYEWPEPFGPVNNRDATDFKNAFKGHEPISFRYGYPDNKHHGHIVVTRRP